MRRWRTRTTCGALNSIPHRSNPLKGRQFPGEVIVLSVRWYLRYPLAYEHVAERGVEVGPSCIWRWVEVYPGATEVTGIWPRIDAGGGERSGRGIIQFGIGGTTTNDEAPTD
jgi:hypothetical protein